MERLEKVCREFKPFAGARTEFWRNSPEKVFKGIVGEYGRIADASLAERQAAENPRDTANRKAFQIFGSS